MIRKIIKYFKSLFAEISDLFEKKPSSIYFKLIDYIHGFPTIGEFGGSYVVSQVYLKSKEFGKSNLFPFIQEFIVDETSSSTGDVGKIVKDKLFDKDCSGRDYGKFIFNVSFSLAKHNLIFGEEDGYTDPASIWFNVFFGYYEIDVPKSEWDRPFGYTDSTGSEVNIEDIIRIGKADWNYFSNYLYGVPGKYIEPYNKVTDDYVRRQARANSSRRIKLGRSYWNHLVIDDIEVVSPYESDSPGSKKLIRNTFKGEAIQMAFGQPYPRKEFKKSFIPVNLKAELYMSFHEAYDYDLSEESYKTYIFGGTINQSYPENACIVDPKKRPGYFRRRNNRFLNEQLREVKRLIVSEHSKLGFDGR